MTNVWMIDPVDQLAVKPAASGASSAEGAAGDAETYAIQGRVLAANGEDFPCRVIKMSTSHAAIVGARRLDAGEIVVVYLDSIGILRGCVSRPLSDGFILQLDLAEARKPTVRAALQVHADRANEAAEKRAAPRIVPVARMVEVRLGEELVFRGLILNVSISGAAIAMKPSERPFEGAVVRAGRTAARVVRLIEKGIAIQFDAPFDPAAFDHNIVL